MWDLLVGGLEEVVDLEVDVYWAARAGRDPVALIEAESSRVALLHMKDMGPAPDRQDMPVGDGTLPWDAILDAGRRAGVEWYVVEQDHPIDPIVSAQRGFTFLSDLSRSGPAA
jgi:sugar phosphate isomerase/epimerase